MNAPPVPWEPDPSFWRDRRVAVTGATGFLGSHLTKLLVGLGADVATLVHDKVPASPISATWSDRVTIVTGDVADQRAVERLVAGHEARTVFHLAARAIVGVANRNPVDTFASNVGGTWTILEACRQSPHVEQIVTASSDKAYGSQPVLPLDEEMPLLAINPYEVSKACADLIAHSYQHAFGTPVCITRCGNFFGPGDRNHDRIVPGTIRSLLRGERPLIRSDGTMVRDYLYVVDGALAYLQLAEAIAHDPTLAGEAFNFSTETPLNVLELVAMLQEAVGTNVQPDFRATATGEIDQQFLSSKKARERLQWQPRYSVTEAIAETVAWYREHLDQETA